MAKHRKKTTGTTGTTGRKVKRTTHKVASLPRRLFYKTKRFVMSPIRKARAHTTTTTTTTPTTTTRSKRPLFGFTRRRKPHYSAKNKLRHFLRRNI